MTGLTLDLSALAQIPELVNRIDAGIAMIEGRASVWYDLKKAAALKGVNYNTLRGMLEYQPNLGKPDALMHGRKHWRAGTIREWLEVTDETRPAYILKCMEADR